MTSPSKRKGDEGEREAEALLRELLKVPEIRRELGAGRKDDMGDIGGVPNTAIQVAWWANWTQAINEKLPGVERQRLNKRVRFGAVFVRRSRNKIPWIVVMTPEQWAEMWRYAQVGIRVERRRGLAAQEKAGKMGAHDRRSPRGRSAKRPD